jgi:hypothetical protein
MFYFYSVVTRVLPVHGCMHGVAFDRECAVIKIGSLVARVTIYIYTFLRNSWLSNLIFLLQLHISARAVMLHASEQVTSPRHQAAARRRRVCIKRADTSSSFRRMGRPKKTERAGLHRQFAAYGCLLIRIQPRIRYFLSPLRAGTSAVLPRGTRSRPTIHIKFQTLGMDAG